MPFFPQVFLRSLVRDLLWEPECTRSPDSFFVRTVPSGRVVSSHSPFIFHSSLVWDVLKVRLHMTLSGAQGSL